MAPLVEVSRGSFEIRHLRKADLATPGAWLAARRRGTGSARRQLRRRHTAEGWDFLPGEPCGPRYAFGRIRAAARPVMAKPTTETLTISDGSTMEITRLPDIDDATWTEDGRMSQPCQVKQYVQSSPETAKSLQTFATNPEAMRGWLQTQAIAEHYNSKLATGDAPALNLERFAFVLQDIKKNGMEAAMKYYQDEELMQKISQKMGGLPADLQPETPLTLHEAAKNGNLAAVQESTRPKRSANPKRQRAGTRCKVEGFEVMDAQLETIANEDFLQKKKPLDSQDHKGITALGYAIGTNRIAVVKLLLDSRANPYAVDSNGNSGLHYAAGYGRKELLEYLLKAGLNVNHVNAQGQTPLTVAQMNKQEAAITFLRANAPLWKQQGRSLLLREDPACKASVKVASFDLNDTLVSSRIGAPGGCDRLRSGCLF
eukprot:g18399.t1